MPPREAVKVAVRLRPMSSKEKEAKYKTIVDIDTPAGGVYVTNPNGEKLSFAFDFAYDADSRQEDVYDQTASPIVAGVLEGFNGTIFAYGQTGTGKTYTMDGVGGEGRGIMTRSFEHIFDHITAHQDEAQFLVTCQYVEIYNDELRDLLAVEKGDSKIRIREDPQKGVYVQGVVITRVNCLDDLYELLALGKKNRVVRKTNMNAESSRSHSILTLVIETLTDIEGSQHVRSARLNLVDLAGSERVAKTGAEGMGFKEGVNINYELMILGNCIAALTARNPQHIPYRDSKLTMLLRDSLGGNARTMMIAAVGPACYNFNETMSTLRYAERAKKIENKPKVNMDPKDALLLQYQEELAALQAQLNGTASVDAQLKSSTSVVRMMEDNFEKQRLEAIAAQHHLQEEQDSLKKELMSREAVVKSEREKQLQAASRLDELKSYLAGGDGRLKQRTEENDRAIRQIKEKLAERSRKAAMLEDAVAKRRSKKVEVTDRLMTVQEQATAVSQEFADLVSQYKNLKAMLPEVERSIQGDREQMSTNIAYLRQQRELLQIVVDNFVPKSEVDKIMSECVFDQDSRKWKRASIDKKTLVQRVISLERPKSATGQIMPTAKVVPARVSDPRLQVDLYPPPIPSRLKSNSEYADSELFRNKMEIVMKADEHDILFDVESCRIMSVPHRPTAMFA